MEAFVGIIIIGLYFVPCIIAKCRGHRNFAAIFAINLFAGWTGIGWLVSLVWALTYQEPTK